MVCEYSRHTQHFQADNHCFPISFICALTDLASRLLCHRQSMFLNISHLSIDLLLAQHIANRTSPQSFDTKPSTFQLQHVRLETNSVWNSWKLQKWWMFHIVISQGQTEWGRWLLIYSANIWWMPTSQTVRISWWIRLNKVPPSWN